MDGGRKLLHSCASCSLPQTPIKWTGMNNSWHWVSLWNQPNLLTGSGARAVAQCLGIICACSMQCGVSWAQNEHLLCVFFCTNIWKSIILFFFFFKFKQVSAFIPPLFGFAIYLYFWLCGVFLEACSMWDPLLRCVGSVAAVLGLGHPKAYGIFSSLIRDGTLLPLYWRWILNPWTTRQVLKNTILKLTS